jgi:hypothetical protein
MENVMSEASLMFVLIPLLSCAAIWMVGRAVWEQRIRSLETDLKACSEAICQMADTQMAVHRRLAATIGDMEERVLDLAVPSRESSHGLDRRHRVLALARKGMALDDIAQRLNLPTGEAELILNLRKYMDQGVVPTPPANGELRNHVQA